MTFASWAPLTRQLDGLWDDVDAHGVPTSLRELDRVAAVPSELVHEAVPATHSIEPRTRLPGPVQSPPPVVAEYSAVWVDQAKRHYCIKRSRRAARPTRPTYDARRCRLNRANRVTSEVRRPEDDSKITSRWLNTQCPLKRSNACRNQAME